MDFSWYRFARSFLFALDPEFSHDVTFNILLLLYKLKILRRIVPPSFEHKVDCFGLSFPNPIGLAAGLDKDAQCLPVWATLGFGFIEVGTVTPKPQLGNKKPRLFRLIEDQALINRMGFNNKGVDCLIEKLKQYPLHCPVGVNIGKNWDTPLDRAADDYVMSFNKVYPFADYIVVNLSSPNTPGLKLLQHGDLLKDILRPLKQNQDLLSQRHGKKVPILVKISPDLSHVEIQDILDTVLHLKVEGIIASNTACERQHLKSPHAQETGGLSGAPLFSASTALVQYIYQHVGDALPIIAVGGIMNPSQAQAKFSAGARLIQLYTGLIYQGPSLISDIAQLLNQKMKKR